MALSEIIEVWDGRQNNYTGDFRRFDYKQERRWVRVFLALESSADISHDTTLTNCLVSGTTFLATGFPTQYSAHPDDSDMILKEFNVAQHDPEAPEWRRIEAVYMLRTVPTDEHCLIEWDRNSYERVIEGAYGVSPLAIPIAIGAGDLIPITNSAYDPFDPPPVRQDPYSVLKVSKNIALADFDPASILANYVKRTNSAIFVVTTASGQQYQIPVGQALLDDPPTAKEAFRNNVHFWETIWQFKIRTRGWTLRIADLGYRYYDFVAGTAVPIFVGGQAAQNPQKLDGAGAQAAINAETVFLEYQIFDTADFNLLNLFA